MINTITAFTVALLVIAGAIALPFVKHFEKQESTIATLKHRAGFYVTKSDYLADKHPETLKEWHKLGSEGRQDFAIERSARLRGIHD